MKKLTITIAITYLLLIYNLATIAQNTPYFVQSINWQNYRNGNGYKLLQKENGNFLIAGTNADTLRWFPFLYELDNVGQTISTNNYIDTNYFVITKTILKVNQNYLMLGSAFKPSYRSYAYSIKLTNDYQLIEKGFVTDTTNFNPIYEGCATTDGEYFAVGENSTYDPPSMPYLVKLDTAGNFSWDRTYPELNVGSSLGLFSAFRDIEPAKDGSGYYLAGYTMAWAGDGNALLAKIANNGDLVWSQTYNLTELDFATAVIETADGGWLLVGRGKISNEHRGLIIKIKSDRSIDWYKTQYFYGGSANHIQELADGSFIIAGDYLNTYLTSLTDSYDFDTEIVKLKANGDYVWRRRIAAGNDDDYVYDMILAKDSSIVICGRTESNLPPNVYANLYILKTNCMGLLTLPQANFTAAMDTAALRASFYNTSQYVYPDSIDGGHYLWQFGDGATSIEQNPTHTYAQGGNYTVTLTAVVCSDTSVFVQTVSTWAVGNELVSANNLVKVFPNPANSYLTVVTTNATQGGNLVLYDMLGRAVKQVTLSNTNTSINVSDLCAGMYLYEVFNSYSSSKQKVTYGKVNVLH